MKLGNVSVTMRCLIALLLLGGVCGCRSLPRPIPPEQSRSFQSLLEWSHQNGMPGAVLLVHSPRTNFIGSVGWADVKRKIPMRPDHAFRLGSTTKMFLGIVTAQLHTERILNTDLVITNFLPRSITDRIPNSDRITVRHLVRHTSGIYNYTDNLRYQCSAFLFDRRGHWSAERLLSYAFDKSAYFAPGEGFRYSNSNFVLLGLILDQVTGHHHSIEIRNRILQPLQMGETYYEGIEPTRRELAHGYEKVVCFWVDTRDWTAEQGEGDSGMVGTASDLARFVRAVTGTNSFLDEPTRKLLKSQPSTSPTDQPWYPVLHYDFGVTAERGAGKDVLITVAPWFFGHGGATAGYVCIAFHEPKNDVTVVYLANSKLFRFFDPRRIDRFERMLKEAVFGLAASDN